MPKISKKPYEPKAHKRGHFSKDVHHKDVYRSKKDAKSKDSGAPPASSEKIAVPSEIRPYLNAIGTPATAPFVPDPFQINAVEATINYDVIVSAPTGSGKTWIATEALKREMSQGRKCWYASPLKALSNSK
ncbi:MAG: hypothetical protein LBT62_03980, partial [Deltaproteobacteria bacterium]|nr:hypothetical protein [Deltaproteobacteria bacterium]